MEQDNRNLPPSEEEDECRVCRGPAEEGYPLFSPCKCSGSIGLTHQDCLTSWLQVQRGNGRCELCSTKFQFSPQYAEGAPETLPWYEVLLGISSTMVSKWLPYGLRITLAVTLWLICVPLATTYSYIAWLHNPSSVSKRFQWDLILNDTISGAVIAGIIIVSFLSLMSFADFLRFNPNQGRRNRDNNAEEAQGAAPDIDVVVLDHTHVVRRRRNVNAVGVMDQRQPVIAENPRRQVRWVDELERPQGMDRFMEGIPDDPVAQRLELQRRINTAATLQEHLNEIDQNDEDEHEAPIHLQPEDEAHIADFIRAMHMDDDHDDDGDDPMHIGRDNFEPQFEPIGQAMDQGGNPDDMEVNLALDELLGLRGPFGVLVRNILWFMAFIITYLGLFAFTPRFLGKSLYNKWINSNSTPGFLRNSPFWNSTEPGSYGLIQLVEEVQTESSRLNRALHLDDLALIVLGYAVAALIISLFQCLVALRQQTITTEAVRVENAGNILRQRPGNEGPAWENPEGFGGIGANDEMEEHMSFTQLLSSALSVASAFVKVGVLLCLKMLALPLTLGIWFDAATLSAFGQSSSSRVLYAGKDLFSALLMHWVVGITFMLLVTVSVLQLREVVHPNLLASIIRPQEPQPDLLGNMMNESGTTHAKRMILSFAIYAFLLCIYIWLPARLLVLTGLESCVPLFRPKLWYILTPQLQVPLELLVFHLTMLGFLEKYKNSIGGLQHYWLTKICKPLGLVDHLLPRQIERFQLVGWKPIFLQCEELEPEMLDDVSESTPGLTEVTSTTDTVNEDGKRNGTAIENGHNVRPVQVDPFWYELATLQHGIGKFVDAEMNKIFRDSHQQFQGVHMKRNGTCTVNGCKDFIQLPLPEAEQDVADRHRRRPGGSLPTELGRKKFIACTLDAYRLRRNVRDDGTMIIEFWKECKGPVIARPPEGWDDLGIGGAEVQGRWAWGNERKSSIEATVAARKLFFGPSLSMGESTMLLCKVGLLLILSWAAISALVIIVTSSPLLTGRAFLQLLRVPDKFVHDPVAFALGLAVLVSTTATASRLRSRASWRRPFHVPSSRKAAVVVYALHVWCLVIPFALGFLYDAMVVKSQEWFSGKVSFLTPSDALRDWGTGFMLLNVWSYLCLTSVFTKEFWAMIINTIFEGEGEINRQNPDPPIGARGNNPWQGSEHGRLARFFNVISGVILRLEWDQVDPEILIDQCVHPVAVTVLMFLAFPCVFVVGWSMLMNTMEKEQLGIVVPHYGLVLEGVIRMTLFRCACIISVAIKIVVSLRNDLQEWYNVVHSTARNDRYLIGEVLLDYTDDKLSEG